MSVVTSQVQSPPTDPVFNSFSHALRQAFIETRTQFLARREPRIIDQAWGTIEQALQHPSDVVLLSLETGTGKTTRLPQMVRYMEFGEKLPDQRRVAVLQPRRITTSEAAFFVAKELGAELGGNEVGFSHGIEEACNDQYKVKIHYLTNGYFLARQSVANAPSYDVIILDEVHERTWEQRFILAKLKATIDRLHAEGIHHRLKLIITSATIDTTDYVRYFDGEAGTPPVIFVKGRERPVSWLEAIGEPAQIAAHEHEQGRRTMVVLSGKEEIERTGEALDTIFDSRDPSARPKILPLHSELSRREQEIAVREAELLLSTPIGTTGLSPRVDTVIDLGERKRMIHDLEGVPELHRELAAGIELQQAAGRVARRTDMPEEGKFYYVARNLAQVPQFPPPEHDLVIPEHQYLRERIAGRDPRRWNFIGATPGKVPERLEQAEKLYIRRGLISEQGFPTQLGQLAARIPAGPIAGKMIVEAMRLDRAGLHLLETVTLAAAITEVRGVVDTDHFEHAGWRKLAGSENGYAHKSDLLAHVEALGFALKNKFSDKALTEHGFILANIHRALESYRSWLKEANTLRAEFRSATPPLKPLDSKERLLPRRDALLWAIWAGMCDQVFVSVGNRSWSNGSPSVWKLPQVTIINRGEYLVGMPHRSERTDDGFSCHISLATEMDAEWYKNHAFRFVSDQHRKWQQDNVLSVGNANAESRQNFRHVEQHS